jgi:predicted MFS family arabinose efflux permease
MLNFRNNFQINPTKTRILLFILPLFFIYLSENVVSLVYPIVAENQLKSNLLLGIVIAGTSVVSIICDLVFPLILNNKTWKRQLILGIILTFFLTIMLDLSMKQNLLSALFIAGAIWSIYYELVSFSINNFLIDEDKGKNYVFDWSIITLVYSFASIVGPILGGLIFGNILIPLLTIQLIGLIFGLVVIFKIPSGSTTVIPSKSKIKQTFNLLHEFKIWGILIPKALPLITMCIVIGVIDSVYWTIGGLYANQAFQNEKFTWVPIVLYSVPFVAGALLMAKLNLKRYRKLLSQVFLLMASLCLAVFVFTKDNLLISLFIIVISSLFLALTEPLNDGVFSNLCNRLGKEMEHLIGIKKVSYSFAYIIGPLFGGWLADAVGYNATFTIIGLFGMVCASLLLVFAPRKIRLPQTEIETISKL